METAFNLETAHLLGTGLLHRTERPYALVLQSERHVRHILALQDAVLAALPEEEKHFLLKRDAAFFKGHFAGGGMVLGVVTEGRLAAQSVIVHPRRADAAAAGMPLTERPDSVSVLQAVAVHPGFRGNRLMQVMVDAWLELAAQQRRTHVFARTSIGNAQSWGVFVEKGFEVQSSDNNRYNLCASLHSRRALQGTEGNFVLEARLAPEAAEAPAPAAHIPQRQTTSLAPQPFRRRA